MPVIITGVTVPGDCYECNFRCINIRSRIECKGRPDNCPLKSVEELIEEIDKHRKATKSIDKYDLIGDCINIIKEYCGLDDEFTDITHWIDEILPLPLSDGSKECFKCSKCGLHYDNVSNYCPNCGSKMSSVIINASL